MDDGRNAFLLERLAWHEAPRARDKRHMGIGCCIPVHEAIAEVEDRFAQSRKTLFYVIDDLWIGFALDAFAFAEDDIKDVREEMVDDFLRSGLVFIACHGEVMPLRFEGAQELRDTIVRTCVIAVMSIIIGHEKPAYAQDIFLRPFVFRQSAPNEVVDAISHFGRIGFDRMGREPGLSERVVAGISQVVNRIEEGAVEVKNDNHSRIKLGCKGTAFFAFIQINLFFIAKFLRIPNICSIFAKFLT